MGKYAYHWTTNIIISSCPKSRLISVSKTGMRLHVHNVIHIIIFNFGKHCLGQFFYISDGTVGNPCCNQTHMVCRCKCWPINWLVYSCRSVESPFHGNVEVTTKCCWIRVVCGSWITYKLMKQLLIHVLKSEESKRVCHGCQFGKCWQYFLYPCASFDKLH